MMPKMTAAMQAVPPAAIARTSTAMNIIRQAGASIGTAVMSVLLASAITRNLRANLGSHTGSGSGGFAALQRLPASGTRGSSRRWRGAFASTFVWALVLIVVAFLPAVGMALSGWKRPLVAPVDARAVVLE